MYSAENLRDPAGFTVVPNGPLRDQSLSLRAKGLFAVMTQLPPTWKFSIAGLVAICKEGRDAVRATLRELEAAGLLVRSQEKDGQGQFSAVVYSIPSRIPGTENPTAERPQTEEPVSVGPTSAETEQLKKEVPKKKEENKIQTRKEELPPTPPEGAEEKNFLFSDPEPEKPEQPAMCYADRLWLDRLWNDYRCALRGGAHGLERFCANWPWSMLAETLGREKMLAGTVQRDELLDAWRVNSML